MLGLIVGVLLSSISLDEISVLRERRVLDPTMDSAGFYRLSFRKGATPWVMDNGDIVFEVQVNDPRIAGPVRTGLFALKSDGSVLPLVRFNELAPGMSPDPTNPELNKASSLIKASRGENGELFLQLALNSTTGFRRSGVWCYADGSFHPVLNPQSPVGTLPTSRNVSDLERFQSLRGESCAILSVLKSETKAVVKASPQAGVRVLVDLTLPAAGMTNRLWSPQYLTWDANANGDFVLVDNLYDASTGLELQGQAGLWRYRASSLELILRTPTGAPGISGVNLLSFNEVAIAPTGDFAFTGTLGPNPMGSTAQMGFSSLGGSIQPLFQLGEPADAAASGAHFFPTSSSGFTSNWVRLLGFLSDSSLIFGTLVSGPEGSNELWSSLWRLNGNQREFWIRSGQRILGLNGIQYELSPTMGIQNYVLKDSGAFALEVYVRPENAGLDLPFNRAIVQKGLISGWRVVAASGMALVNPPGTSIVDFKGSIYNNIQFQLSSSGYLTFEASVRDSGAVTKSEAQLVSEDAKLLRGLMIPVHSVNFGLNRYDFIGISGLSNESFNSSAVVGFQSLVCRNDPPYTDSSVLEVLCSMALQPSATSCRADTDGSGAVTLQDLFDFLRFWFDLNGRADIDLNGSVTLQDLFDYLTAYFEGCQATTRKVSTQ